MQEVRYCTLRSVKPFDSASRIDSISSHSPAPMKLGRLGAISIGDQLPQSECLVVKQLTSANGHVMLSLDCNKKPASAANG